MVGTTSSRLAAPPVLLPVEVPFPPAPAAVVAEGELRIVLRLAFPITVLLSVLFPGPTKKKVAPRRVRLPVSSANLVRLKLVRLAGTVPFMTVTLLLA